MKKEEERQETEKDTLAIVTEINNRDIGRFSIFIYHVCAFSIAHYVGLNLSLPVILVSIVLTLLVAPMIATYLLKLRIQNYAKFHSKRMTEEKSGKKTFSLYDKEMIMNWELKKPNPFKKYKDK